MVGCAIVGGDPNAPRLQAQAEAALARWADAVAGSGGAAFVPVGELTGQIGDWEAANGDNKLALMSGAVEAATALSAEVPPDGQVRWPNGTTATLPLISAAQALEDIRTGGAQPCSECRPIRVTGARLTSGAFETSRGQATVPVWAFTIEGSAVQITRVAIASRVAPSIPPWDPEHAPVGISVDRAALSSDGLTLTVSFVGAPNPASEPCGEDYTGRAVESDLAVVAIVLVQRNLTPAGCAAVGALRTAVLHLAKPLGERAVLEVQEGRPVAVTPES
ncbi:MAG TPA: hypothetical protein VJ506_04865 [Candidatus Limnocylindrales bacterium]|nr:hypothetical protein [Candidatus Limnocylindrales bacterium]